MKEKSLQKSSDLAIKDKFCFINDRMRSVFEKIIVIGLLLADALVLSLILMLIGAILDDRTDTYGLYLFNYTLNSYTEILHVGSYFVVCLLSAYAGVQQILQKKKSGYLWLGLPVLIGVFFYWFYIWLPMKDYVH